MDFELLLKEFQVYEHLMALLVGMPRLFVVAQTVPFLATAIVTGQVRTALVFAMYLPLHPVVMQQLPSLFAEPFSPLGLFGALMLKEVLIGLLLSFLASIVFFAMMSAGFFIDNQRGASMAMGPDPLSGEQTTPLGSLLFQAMVYIFFTSGAFIAFLSVLYASYEMWPITSLTPLQWKMAIPLFFAEQVSWLMAEMLLLAGPIVVVCLLADVALGLVNRFASQLNVYVLAMPVKSALAALLLLGYFSVLMGKTPELFAHIESSLRQLQRLLP